jgi:hypothetical protein
VLTSEFSLAASRTTGALTGSAETLAVVAILIPIAETAAESSVRIPFSLLIG